MKLKELRDQLNDLTDEQLEQHAIFQGFEREGGMIGGIWIATEDHINPSGDGAEPVSTYEDDDDFDVTGEPVVIKSGTVLVVERDPVSSH